MTIWLPPRPWPDTPTLYLLRHGQTVSDGVKRYVGRTNLPLSDRGRRQAAGWAEAFQRNLAPGRVVTSGLDRSLDTGRPIAEAWGVDWEIRPELNEIDLGDWDGRPMDRIRADHPEAFERRGRNPAHFRPPGGESFADVWRRAEPVFEELAGSAPGAVVICGHAGVNRAALASWLGASLDRVFSIRQDYGCLNVVACGGRPYIVRAVNLTPHIPDANFL